MGMRNIVAMGLTVACTLLAGPAWAETVTLRYSSWLPLNHHLNVRVLMPWFEEVAKVTDGRVKIETLPKMVGTPQSQYDVVRDGLADISFIIAGYTPGRFTLAEVGELPFMGNDPVTMAPTFNRIYRKYMEPLGEFEGVKLLSIFTNLPGNVFTNKKPVAKFEDFKGLKLRSTGPAATEALNLIGAIPILKSSAEGYELLTTGAIDGTLGYAETVHNFNMIPLLTQGTLIPGGIYGSPMLVAANPAAWAKISPEDQKAIEGIAHEKIALAVGKTYEIAENDGKKAMVEAEAQGKFKLVTASPELVADLKKALAPLDEKWAERAKAKGLADPLKVLEELRAEIAAQEKNK